MNQKIKVFHIMTGGLNIEGIASTQLVFFQNMDMNKIQIDVAAVCRNSSEMIKEYKKAGCNVIVFPDRTYHTVKYFIALLRYLHKEKYDIVHVHVSSALMSIELMAAYIARIPVRIAHSRNTKANNVKLDKLLRPLFGKLYTDAMACGEEAGIWLFEKQKFTVIHNGKDFSKFRYDSQIRQSEREKYDMKEKTVIGHVGAFNYQKNHEYLVDVFCEYLKKNENSVLYMLGDGELRQDIYDKAEKLGILDKTVFAGNVRDVADRLQAMDIMVFPSRFEGLPNVVLEWQAEGLPCLVSDKITKECAPSNLVKFASIEEDPKVWADKIEEMLIKFDNRKFQAKYGTNSLKQHGFDIVDATKELQQIYKNLVDKKRI